MCVYYSHTDGIPPDGRPNEVDLGIHIGVSVIFILMATIGIVFALIGMSLHFLLRKKTYCMHNCVLYVQRSLSDYN